jgi:hypothetical protein
MDLGPIPGIHRISAVNAPEKERDLLSPLPPVRSERMGDDDYREHGDEPGREPADENNEALDQDQPDTAPDSGAPDKKINLIA